MANVKDMLDDIETMVLSGLKDFQRATVDRIDFLYRSGKKRVLVSDEVGLGKTLIARGTVAKFAKLRKEEGDDLVKVVYICSNAAIADQNLNKLKIARDIRSEDASYARLSMQHLNIYRQERDTEVKNGYIQLIPLTPDTSFRVTSGTGMASERALMYAILRHHPQIRKFTKQLEQLMVDNAIKRWPIKKEYYEKEVEKVNNATGGKYLIEMLDNLKKELEKEFENGESYIQVLRIALKKIKIEGKNPKDYNYIVKQLRYIFAKVTLDKLDPDLVIMDEFQRFKFLLNAAEDTDIGMLASRFFNAKRPPRMLLLSATPYKMYSTLEEIEETNNDEHYSEFLSVMEFLNHYSEKDAKNFKEVWSNYSLKLKEFTEGDDALIVAKNAAEEAMYGNVCRTERISEAENADIIDSSDVKNALQVLEADIRSYIDVQGVLDSTVKLHVPIDYVKSAPYLFSFMREYKLKTEIEDYFTIYPNEVNKAKKDTLWLNKEAIDNYEKIPENNARLKVVMDKTFQDNVELLLWMPPAVPYYEPEGVYKNIKNFTKTLIFSSWEMVPRMLSALISYESERLTIGKLNENERQREVRYFAEGEKRYPSQRLIFSVKEGTPGGMNLFTLLYPSKTLAGCYDPIRCFNRKMSLGDIEREVGDKISKLLEKFKGRTSGLVDNRWYYILPLLLDEPSYVNEWLDHAKEIAEYGLEEEGKKVKQKGFNAHINQIKEIYAEYEKNRTLHLGKMPADLINVLTDMAIASPAICVLRTYEHYFGKPLFEYNYMPSQIGRIFINRMNTAESTAVIELACGKKNDDAHWKNVLTYCKHGNFQAMYDEYAHLITNGIDDNEMLLLTLHQLIKESMDYRTCVYEADTFKAFTYKVKEGKGTTDAKISASNKPAGIRSHFATAFTKGDNSDQDKDRKKSVRNAFNSPFRPFVLASTSIGQEGLDFHNYCRRIVHWNLPSNPIDLEQREGRINRFECLAIRQNIAMRYGNNSIKNDVWKEFFEIAKKKEKKGSSSDLIPYWGLKASDDMVKIERVVPLYPFSRDTISYERLIKILSLYRLTLGQARQEELLEYLFNNCENPEKLKSMFINLSPFYKK